MPRIGAFLMVGAIAVACSCAPKRPAVAPGPTPAARLAAADALVRAGCFDCLTAAYREYDALRSTPLPSAAEAATAGAIRSAALLAMRERELGTEDSGYLKKARDLAAAPPTAPVVAALLEIADTLPTRGAARMVGDDIELARMQAANRNRAAWTDTLRRHADEDPFAAYLWLSFNCAYTGTGQQTVGEWLAVSPTWRETPLLVFKAATCSTYTRASFDALLTADPRFKELHYFIGLAAAFTGKIDESMEHLLLAHTWRPRWPAITNLLAGDYIALEEFDKAIEFYDRTLEVVSTFPDALLGKAKAQTYAGRPIESIATIDRLLALERWLVGDARYWRAVNENQLDRLEVAWDDVELAAKLMRNAEVPKLAGIIAYRRKQLDVARAKFDESWKAGRGEDCETGFYLGIVLGEQAQWPRTAEVLVATVACLETGEQKLTAEIASIRANSDRPDRQERQIRRREQDIAKGRRMRATSWFNLAVSSYSLARNDQAREYAEKVADDEQFGERARDLLSRLR